MTTPTVSTPRRRRHAPGPRITPTLDGGYAIELALDPRGMPGPDPTSLLLHTACLPGNARVAAFTASHWIVADLPPGPRGRAETLVDALAVAASARPLTADTGAATSCDPDALGALLRAGRFEPDAIAARARGVEVRVSLDGLVRPVTIDPDGTGLRLTHRLITSWPTDAARDAAADQALRVNGRVRFARLALQASDRHGHELHAEARLDALDVTPAFLARTVRAIAAFAQHAAPSLQLLCGDADLRARYARAILGHAPIHHDPNQGDATS